MVETLKYLKAGYDATFPNTVLITFIPCERADCIQQAQDKWLDLVNAVMKSVP
jgi:hypothetical protein